MHLFSFGPPDISQSYRERLETESYGFLYGLPSRLLGAMKRQPKIVKALDKTIWRVDEELAELFDKHDVVGFQGERALNCHILSPSPAVDIPSELMKEWAEQNNWSPERIRKNLDVLQPRLAKARRAAQAFAGWLLVNKDFIAEHNQLFGRWREHLRFGLPKAVVNSDSETYVVQHLAGEPAGTDEAAYGQEFCDFYRRWDLIGLAGPYLPLPIQQHVPAFPHGLTENSYRSNTATVSFPANEPLPTADELRATIESISGRRSGEPHLRGWYGVVENANRNRQRELEFYGHLFEVVHFWRVLHQHYGKQLHGRIEDLQSVFSAYCGVSETTIKACRDRVRKQLGRQRWLSIDDV